MKADECGYELAGTKDFDACRSKLDYGATYFNDSDYRYKDASLKKRARCQAALKACAEGEGCTKCGALDECF